ncbi:ABC transporter substrate-binding protein [Streptomyces sp. ST2-7A]|uniref:ABC transporter substrate-binding protein n=1 Tax=Streptomyces sp. ST2-7A TaxID=2907214 RepID=UPI001F1B2DAA|nr:ABC transporter substrate-binding protein [Streptomyces sp. ST2-7A]MCE7080469.1 ABC transporter substrate-binding protein [Streptomyces sp. ST2-7A]
MSPNRRPAAALLLIPLLAGCFSENGSAGTDGGPDAVEGSGDARLRVALAFPPTENLSPHGADATLLSRLGVTEGLTVLDDQGLAAPALAESWTAEDELTTVFTLREALFHTGEPVTAEAVADAIEQAVTAEPAPAALSGVELTAEAAGDREVRITTAEPDPILPLRLAAPHLAILAPDAYEDDTVDPAGHGTGPYVLTSVTGAERASLDRFEEHWNGPAAASGIEASFIADGLARGNALRSGEVDIAEAIPVSAAATLDEGALRETRTTRTTGLLLNTASGALTDPELRAAVREAVDTAALAEGVYEGYADPGEGVFGPAVIEGAGERPEPVNRAEPADADAIEGTAITIATYDNRPELPEVAQVVQQQLEAVGFTVALEVREYSRIESDALAGEFDIFVAARNTLLDTGDPLGVLAGDYTCDGGYNLALLCDPGVDRAVADAAAIADPEERREAILAAEAAILGTDALVPLVHQRTLHGVDPAVEDVILDPYERTLIGRDTRR